MYLKIIIPWILILTMTACSSAPKRQSVSKKKKTSGAFGQGQIYQRAGLFEKAISEYTKFIEERPNNRIVYSLRARAYAQSGNMEASMADYEIAKKLDKEHNIAEWCTIFHRGESMAILGAYDRAIADFSRVIQDAPKRYKGYFTRGKVRLATGDYENALNDFDQAILRLSGYTLYYYRSLAHEGLGNLSLAISDMQKCVRLGGPYADAKYAARLNRLRTKAASSSGARERMAGFPLIQLKIDSLVVHPVSVTPGGRMEVTVKYALSDELIAFDSIPLFFGYTIKTGDKVLFKSKFQKIFIPHHKSVTRRVDLRAGRIGGNYTIEVFFKYKEIVKSKTVGFTITQ